MSFPVRMRLPLAMLKELAPDGPLDQAWVVLVGHRELLRTLPGGRPLWGDIAVWDPVPAPPMGQDGAMALAQRLIEAELDGICAEWHWHPIDDDLDDGQALELYAVVDGDLARMEVAIAPLTALLADVPGALREGR